MTDAPVSPELLLEEEMKESYLTYAMSVLIDRALPDIRDGFKPVHRRIMYSMRDLNLTAGAKYQKSAKIVGHCLGNYHPHGDTSVYDAMVRMAQDFSLRYMLVDGQGNFGSVDGDPAAAYRYTEARMSRFGEMLLEDIQYDTVPFKPTFDESREEPAVLPGKLPNLLVNGSSGIAVGMATNIPPHNLTEVCQGIIHLIDNPACTVGDLMQFVKAPDFPTGGQVCGTAGLREAYETGRGRVIMRAAIERETIEGRDAFVVTSIPYGLKTQTIKESIQAAHENENVTGLHSVSGGDQKEGLRIEITLKRGEDPDVVLNQLWQHTHLQYTFALNMIALDGGRPRTVSLKRMMQAYVEHRKEVIIRRTRFLLARDEARLHIVAGLLKAIDIIDQIIALIRSAPTSDVARSGLIQTLGFSERQAQAILEMQLRRLTGLERDKLQSEHDALVAAITDYRDILARDERQYAIIKADLVELIEKYGDERRTKIGVWSGDMSMEDLIEDVPCVVTITKSGYIKRLPVDTFRVQRRGGRGVSGGALKGDEDFISQVFTATNHQYLLIFTSLGRVHWLKVYQIPEAAPALLLRLLDVLEEPNVRARIAELLGDLGAAKAYPALRAMLKDLHPNVRSAAESALERLVYRPAYRLNVRTLGAFGVWRGEVEIRDRDWRSVKARQLLQLLLVERGRMIPRDRIMDMLWPGLEADAAANNLRVTLSRLTKAIEPTRPEGAPTYYVMQQGDTYGFNVAADHQYDTATFSTAVDQGRNALMKDERPEAITHFRRAIGLYGGTFLPDCLYEDWSVVERERLSLLFTEASLKLGSLLLEDGHPHEAIGLAWRVLEYDQAQEEAYQLLMRAYGGLGERSTALRLYARCVQALEQELGVEPMPETEEIYEHIRGG